MNLKNTSNSKRSFDDCKENGKTFGNDSSRFRVPETHNQESCVVSILWIMKEK